MDQAQFWIPTKDDRKILSFLLGIMACASGIGAFILRFLPEGGGVVVWDFLGTRVHLSPASVALAIVAALVAEALTVLNMRKPSRQLETVVIVLFTTLTASLALLFGRYFLSSLMAEAFATLMLVLSIAVFAGVYILFLVLIDVPSERAKNLALGVFSVATGAFIATSFQTWVIIAVLIGVIAVDALGVIVIGRGSRDGEYERTRTALTTRSWAVGLGELLTYSIITAHAYVLAGFLFSAVIAGLILVAAALTLRMMTMKSLQQVPGLPLTLTPSVIVLLAVWFLSAP